LKKYLEVSSNQAYVISRIKTLSEDRFLQGYRFDGGEESDVIKGVIKRQKTDPTDARILMHCFREYMNDCLYRETSAQAQAHLQAHYYDSQAARPTFNQLHWVPLEQAKELDKVCPSGVPLPPPPPPHAHTRTNIAYLPTPRHPNISTPTTHNRHC
jgi:hypothetical protein